MDIWWWNNMVVSSIICTYTRLYKYRVLKPNSGSTQQRSHQRQQAGQFRYYPCTLSNLGKLYRPHCDLSGIMVFALNSVSDLCFFQFQWQYGQQFIEVQQGWGWTDGLPILRSGYGLCGFFIAGNEHVLIGTKAWASVFGGDISREQFKVWKRWKEDFGETFLFMLFECLIILHHDFQWHNYYRYLQKNNPYGPCMEYLPTWLGHLWGKCISIFQHHRASERCDQLVTVCDRTQRWCTYLPVSSNMAGWKMDHL